MGALVNVLLGQVRSEKSRLNGLNGIYFEAGLESMLHLFVSQSQCRTSLVNHWDF